jgi:hypothetical protein
METFLGLAARNIFENHTLNQLQHLQIILPSRRAALYFKAELASLSAVPFFSPEIHSIDDFIQKASGLRSIDPIDLYFEVFDIWKKLDSAQPFEKFLTWVPTLVKDFNLIDSSLLENPHLLFKYMSEAEALNRWDMTADEHIFSANSTNYFTFFDRMAATYEELKVRLLEKGLSYTGLAYRKVAENFELLLSSNTQQYYFVGLNALSRAEERVIEGLVKAKKATCIWDSDNFYMNSKDKAGRKLRLYKSSGKYGSGWSFQGDYLLGSEKIIHVFELNSKVLQSKLAVDLAANSASHSHVMIVLDESDFSSLFVQLPSLDTKYNVSAGIAFKATSLAGLLDAYSGLLDFPDESIPLNIVKGLLSLPALESLLIKELGQEKFENLVKQTSKMTHLYVTKKRLSELFSESIMLNDALNINDPTSFLTALKRVLARFMELESDEKSFAFLIEEKLGILENRLEDNPHMSIDAFKIILRELVKNVSVPFEKQPDARLQVMSMLETRCLDFEEVTLLSFLEGNLPSGKKSNSFMPYDAAKFFDLPLYSDQDAIMAYHFFRLLQRARKINLVYQKSAGGEVGRKEVSRFLSQIREELITKNPKIEIKYPEVKGFSSDEKAASLEKFQVNKTPEIMEKLKTFLEKRGLSPTSINEYFKSDVGFYWRYVEKISSKEEDSTDIGHNVFGSIIHYVLEMTDKTYFEKNALITREILMNQKQYALENFDKYVKENQPDSDFTYGLNSVLKTLAKELIGKYFDKRLREFTVPFKIVGIEKEYTSFIEIDGVKVKILGKLDKLEQHGNTLTVIDYKTGKVEAKEITFKEKDDIVLLDFLQDAEKEKFRQLCLYNFLLSNHFEDIANFEFKFYSFRSLENDLNLQVGNHTRDEVLFAVNSMLENLIKDLLDERKPFGREEENKIKEYSDFYELLV